MENFQVRKMTQRQLFEGSISGNKQKFIKFDRGLMVVTKGRLVLFIVVALPTSHFSGIVPDSRIFK